MGKRRLLDKARTRTRLGYRDDLSEDGDCSDDSRTSIYENTTDRKPRRKRHKPRHGPTDSGKLQNVLSHPRSSHNIQSPNDIRTALLRWYAVVHTSRGMPWRKPYDPSQGPEERAQRAYEVCLCLRSREATSNDLE